MQAKKQLWSWSIAFFLKFKDARSASLYPNNRSQILQCAKYTNKLTMQKEMQNFVANNVFWDKKKKTLHQETKNSNIKTIAGVGN